MIEKQAYYNSKWMLLSCKGKSDLGTDHADSKMNTIFDKNEINPFHSQQGCHHLLHRHCFLADFSSFVFYAILVCPEPNQSREDEQRPTTLRNIQMN